MKKFDDLLELLFEHRNKAYGAYQLRREENRTMRNSLFLGLSLPVLALLMAGFWGGKVKLVETPGEIIDDCWRKFKMTLQKPPEFDPDAVLRKTTTIKFVPPLPTPDDDVKPETDFIPQSKLQTAIPSNHTQTGHTTDPTDPIEPTDPGPTTPPVPPAAPPDPEKIYTFVSEMPKFPGGEAELLNFIAKNYKLPPIARETGIQGKVFISFVVETDGSLSDIVVVKNPGGGLGKEAVRVLQSMPNWTAGNQNGRAVRVRMNLPITVCLQ